MACPPVVDVDVFDRDFLLPFAAMPIEGFQKRGVRTRKLVRLQVWLSERQT
jgi:hypothetical protein